MDDNFIPAGEAASDVVVRLATRQNPALMRSLMGSLDKLDPQKAAEVRRLEAFKAKAAINACVARLRDAAGAEAAAQFLRDRLAVIEKGEGAHGA